MSTDRGGKLRHLGTFATAEEAALCLARDAASTASVDSGQQEPSPPQPTAARAAVMGAVSPCVLETGWLASGFPPPMLETGWLA